MKVLEFLKDNRILFDGGTGTLLQAAGLPLGELPERWNLTHPEVIEEIHAAYFDAGSHIVCTNTFGANGLKFAQGELEDVIAAGVALAKRGALRSKGAQPKFVALDIGPCGRLLKPYGDFPFEEAFALFAQTVRLGVKYGVDLIYIETMGDSLEAKAAVLAAKENSELPVFVSCAYGEDGKLLTGATPAAMVATLEGLGVDVIGVNCSVGPKQMQGVVEELLNAASVPVLVKPNAGLPTQTGGYALGEEEFASYLADFVQAGVRLVGGCCGTTPDYIRAVKKGVEGLPVLPVTDKQRTCVSSYTHAVVFDEPVLIGERINPTGKKRFQQALKEGDTGYVLAEGIAQEEKGAHILDVNVGAPEIDEAAELPRYVEELQAVLSLPLQLDTANPTALERAMRVYNGKPLVNSVNGKKESMAAVFPLVKKYGGAVVALTLDEQGIPDSVEGRLQIAERIIAEGAKYGVAKKDILVDALAMAVSADENAAAVTLATVKALSARGIKTSLGVSNVSFGLPNRETVNAAFFFKALENGLSAAIFNPHSLEMQKVYYAHLLLSGRDKSCARYIAFAQGLTPSQPTPKAEEGRGLQQAIIKGLKEEAAAQADGLLKEKSPLEIIDGEIVPALDAVGRAYEEKRAFLPQLLVSAEAAKAAFERVKRASATQNAPKKGRVLLATVKGDIHDIGKNIVATLLENYGFSVLDLGKDVPPERVLEGVERENVRLVGLSALMTTTLPSMAETVALVKARHPEVKILVGGAVVTKEYADKIGADGYAKDAMSSVRFAESVYEKS